MKNIVTRVKKSSIIINGHAKKQMDLERLNGRNSYNQKNNKIINFKLNIQCSLE